METNAHQQKWRQIRISAVSPQFGSSLLAPCPFTFLLIFFFCVQASTLLGWSCPRSLACSSSCMACSQSTARTIYQRKSEHFVKNNECVEQGPRLQTQISAWQPRSQALSTPGRGPGDELAWERSCLAVRKIMEAMCAAYAESGSRSQHVSNCRWGKLSRKAREYCESKARMACEQRFISLNRLMNPVVTVLLECVTRCSTFFLLVRINEFLYANFLSTCVRCTHFLKS